ncbi:TonB-dependent receptor [Acetobacter sp.]|uniref:TonB-dependent receptor n=1 Tax=Acetobacter sp. TaxID=440 RepID=UPI0025BBA783|nr:TonB-dependent receptor [Acetobacter sp.]MCH4090767.1 TonB-dependent receptor [Acetobacter sp.]MCI1300517.1 TonB-dependent receptor [Acetobacter sp.]MCI1316281.1 TonB-dependent receptor [Acetobacter sp.]
MSPISVLSASAETVQAAKPGRLHAANSSKRHQPTSPAPRKVAGGKRPSSAAELGVQGQLETVNVTAEHRVGTTSKTPIAMSVYGREQIKSQNVHDLASLSAIAPDVSLAASGNQSIITVRGISSRDTSEVGDPAVSVNIDGFYLNRTYALNSTLFDMERIEVLRGPQGTLNGRNAVGGAINIVTAKPKKKFESEVALTYGNYDTLIFDGMVNVPITDKVQARVAFTSRSHEGYRVTPPNGRGDDEDAKSGRIELAFQPTEHLDGLLEFQMTHQGGYGQGIELIPFSYNADGSVSHEKPKINSHKFDNPSPSGLDMLERTLRWTWTYHLNPFDISYIGGYDAMRMKQARNYGGPSNSPPFASIDTWNANESPRTQNQEIRFASHNGGRVTWQAGAYYFEEDNSLFSYDGTPTSYSNNTRLNGYQYDVTSRSLSGYGNVKVKLIDGLSISGGVRYNWDTKDRVGAIQSANELAPPFTFSSTQQNANASWTKATWHAGAEWQFKPTELLYFKADTGYKPGGFTEINAYGPETVLAYEGGLKSVLWHNRLHVDMDGFYETYTGQQVTQLVSTTYGAAERIINAGSSKVYGAELNVNAALPYIGTIGLFGQWLHARFTNFQAETNGVNVQYAGNALPQAPDYTLGLSLDRRFAIPTGRLAFHVQSKMTSPSYLMFYNYNNEKQGYYSMTNVNVDYIPQFAGADRYAKWKVGFYVRNLENSTVFVTADENTFGGYYRYGYMPPRTYGFNIDATF